MALRIAVLVKEVPDAAVARRIAASTGRLDRSGETNLNPDDTHAIECAVQLREGSGVEVAEIVAVTMGPDSAKRTLHRAVSLGADRSIHLCDDALAGSDVLATGYALATVLRAEAPDLVLLGGASQDGECYAVAGVLAEYLEMPAVTQVTELTVRDGMLCLQRQAEYGYDQLQLAFPAVISVADTLNEPRYPSLKAIMGARQKPILRLDVAQAGIDPTRVGPEGSQVRCGGFHPPAARPAGQLITARDAGATAAEIVRWLEARKLL